jgi:site-specific DNA-methyltransferase (adenine-specific)
VYGEFNRSAQSLVIDGVSDSGSAARFFYTAKADGKDRGVQSNDHPTVKPTDLIRYLVMLVTPPGGLILDPFMGSGTTLRVALDLGHPAIGIDSDEHSCEIAAKRLSQGVLDFGAKE